MGTYILSGGHIYGSQCVPHCVQDGNPKSTNNEDVVGCVYTAGRRVRLYRFIVAAKKCSRKLVEGR